MPSNIKESQQPEAEVFNPESFAGLRAEQDGVAGYLGTIRGKPRFIADDPEASPAANMGAFEAAMINAGELTATTLDRIGAATGDPAAAHRVQQSEASLAPISEAHPIASAVGRSLPQFVLPGGMAAQVGGGALFGALESPESPGIGATVGGSLGALGKVGGDYVGDLFAARRALNSSSVARQAKGQAIANAKETGFPLTIANKTDSLVAQFFDRQSSTVLGRAVKGPTKQRALNRAFAKSIGVEGADAITGDVLSKAANQYGEVFERAASTIEAIPLTQAFGDNLDALAATAKELVPNARAMKQLDIVENFALGDLMNGQQYNRLRSQLSKISRNEWSAGGDQVSGEFVDGLIGVLDQALVEAAPDMAAELVPARSGWRQLLAMRRGAALDPSGNVNPVSMARSMEKVYPGLDLNRFSPGAVGQAQRANLAATAFPEFRSSGTSERGIMGNVGAIPAGLGDMVLGGGHNAQLGGGAARSTGASITATADGLLQFLNETDTDPDATTE